jgi:hypothetical protein
MDLKIIRKNGTSTTTPATLGNIVFDRRTNDLWLEIVVGTETRRIRLAPMDSDLVEPPVSSS